MVVKKPTPLQEFIALEQLEKRSSVYVDPDSDLCAHLRYVQIAEAERHQITCFNLWRKGKCVWHKSVSRSRREMFT
jgi:hypothetical protein